mgnify:CR=1 FL=1
MKKLWNTAFAYLIGATVFEVGLAGILEATGAKAAGAGVVARPMGLIVHTHLLALGFVFYIMLMMLEKLFALTRDARFPRFQIVYNAGLVVSALVMAYRSFAEIFGYAVSKGLAMGVGTLAHIAITFALIEFALMLKKAACADAQTKAGLGA